MSIRQVHQWVINAGVFAAFCVGFVGGYVAHRFGAPVWVPATLWLIAVLVGIWLQGRGQGSIADSDNAGLTEVVAAKSDDVADMTIFDLQGADERCNLRKLIGILEPMLRREAEREQDVLGKLSEGTSQSLATLVNAKKLLVPETVVENRSLS